jgi:hypothetical protein
VSGTGEPGVSQALARTLAREKHRRRFRRVAFSAAAVAFLLGGALSAIGWTRPAGGAKIASASTLRAKQVSAAIAAAAEAEANAPAAAAPAPAPAAAPAPAPKTAQKPATSTAAQTFSIAIGGTGYEPSQVVAAAGRPITLKVAKGEGCAGGFLMPSLGVDKDNSGGPVSVKLGPLTAGSYEWTCGMGMVSGTLVVR